MSDIKQEWVDYVRDFASRSSNEYMLTLIHIYERTGSAKLAFRDINHQITHFHHDMMNFKAFEAYARIQKIDKLLQ